MSWDTPSATTRTYAAPTTTDDACAIHWLLFAQASSVVVGAAFVLVVADGVSQLMGHRQVEQSFPNHAKHQQQFFVTAGGRGKQAAVYYGCTHFDDRECRAHRISAQ